MELKLDRIIETTIAVLISYVILLAFGFFLGLLLR